MAFPAIRITRNRMLYASVNLGNSREHDRRVVAESEIKTRRFYGAAALFSIVASHRLTNIPAQPNVIATAPPAIFSMADRGMTIRGQYLQDFQQYGAAKHDAEILKYLRG